MSRGFEFSIVFLCFDCGIVIVSLSMELLYCFWLVTEINAEGLVLGKIMLRSKTLKNTLISLECITARQKVSHPFMIYISSASLELNYLLF